LQSLQSLATQLLPADKSVVFVDNHDNQRGENLRYADANYRNAAIFLLAHPAGYPALMSSYGFDRSTAAGRDAGPPSTAGGVTQSTFNGATSLCSATLGAPQVGSWICEHRVPAIAAMVAFRKAAAGAPLSNCGQAGGWEINADPNRIAFCRDGAGFVALSRSSVDGSVNLPTRLPPGSYCNVAVDQFTPAVNPTPASCSGAAIVVGPAPTGLAAIPLPAGGAVALHVGAKLP
jgi:alpha-amylase